MSTRLGTFLRTQVRAPSRAARWGAGFIPQERAREAGRRQYLTPSRSRSSLRTQVRAPLPLREEPRHLGDTFSLRVTGRHADNPSLSEKFEMRAVRLFGRNSTILLKSTKIVSGRTILNLRYPASGSMVYVR